MHKGITAHPIPVTAENLDQLPNFDFVFVCIDKGSSRREIAAGLHRREIPFVDTGIGVGMVDGQLDGCARATFIHPDMAWTDVAKLLPFGDDSEEDDLYRSDIQIAAVNSLNAVLAIMRWKRWSDFFRDERREANSVYMIEGNNISNRAA
jgi:hypothetical protein